MNPIRTPFTPAPGPDPTAEPGPVQALVLRLLNKYGLSQGQVDRETGIDQSRISRYARGLSTSGLDDVFKLIELEKRLEAKAQAEAQAAAPAPTSG